MNREITSVTLSTHDYLIKVREIITKDPLAIAGWRTVKDTLINSPAERQRVDKSIQNGEIEEAVLKSLELWSNYYSEKATLASLVQILRKHGLNAVADKLLSAFGETQNCPGVIRGAWFGVGDLVHNFTGRVAELSRLHQILQDSQTNQHSSIALITRLTGLGGIGKTTLARKYAHLHYSDYDGNFLWINGASLNSMRGSFKGIGNQLRMSVADKIPDEVLAQLVYKCFRRSKCVFIFDNVERFDDLDVYRPKNLDPGDTIPHILVTTRVRNLIPNPRRVLDLGVLSLSEAVSFILEEVKEATRADAEYLAKELQMLPLALQQAVAYIRQTYVEDKNSINHYIADFKKSAAAILGRTGENFAKLVNYEETTLTTWQLTLKMIERHQDGEMAVSLIKLMSYLNPDEISVEMLCILLQQTDFPMHSGKGCKNSNALHLQQTASGLKLLEKFSMIAMEKSVVRIHRLVQHVIHCDIGPDEQKQLVRAICEVLQKSLKGDKFTDAVWEHTTHGIQVIQYLVQDHEMLLQFFETIDNISLALMRYGSYNDAFAIAEQLERILKTILHEDDERLLRAWFRLAYSFNCLGKNVEARDLLLTLTSSVERVLGKHHHLAFDIYRLLTHVYSSLGDHQRAVDLCDYTIPLQEEMLGHNDVRILKTKFSKATALFHLEKYEECQQLIEYIYEEIKDRYGSTNHLTLNIRNWTARVMRTKGDLTAALKICKEVLFGATESLGADDPFTIRCQNIVREVEKSYIFSGRSRRQHSASVSGYTTICIFIIITLAILVLIIDNPFQFFLNTA